MGGTPQTKCGSEANRQSNDQKESIGYEEHKNLAKNKFNPMIPDVRTRDLISNSNNFFTIKCVAARKEN